MDFSSLLNQAYAQLEKKRKAQMERVELLTNLEKQDKMVSEYAMAVSPSKTKPKSGKYFLGTDAIDATIAEDHPMKGFAPEMRRRFQTLLQNPKFDAYTAPQLLQFLSTVMYTEPGPDGESLHSKSLRYKYVADNPLFGGEDTTVRKPLGYDAYKTRVDAIAEKQRLGEELDVGEWLTRTLEAGAYAGGAGALIGGVATLSPAGAGIGAITAATGGALAEAVMYPVKQLAHKIPPLGRKLSRWKVAKAISDDWFERLKPELASFALDLPLFMRGEKIARRLVTIPKMVATQALARPTAENILKLGAVREGIHRLFVDADTAKRISTELVGGLKHSEELGRGATSLKEVMQVLKEGTPILGRRYGKGWRGKVADPSRYIFEAEITSKQWGGPGGPKEPKMSLGKTLSKERIPGIGMAEEAPIAHHIQYLDEKGIEEAFNDPGGPIAGVKKASNRQARRELATGKIKTEEAESIYKNMYDQATIIIQKAAGGAITDLDAELKKIDEIITATIAKAPTEARAQSIYQFGEKTKAAAVQYHNLRAKYASDGLNAPGAAKDVLHETTKQTTAEAIVNEIPDVVPDSVMAGEALAAADAALKSGQDPARVAKTLSAMAGKTINTAAVEEYNALVNQWVGMLPSRMTKRLDDISKGLETKVLYGELSPQDALQRLKRAQTSVADSLEAMADRGDRAIAEPGELPRGAETVTPEPTPTVPLTPAEAANIPEPGIPEPPSRGTEGVSAVERPEGGRRVYVRDTYTDRLRAMSNKEFNREANKYIEILKNPEGSSELERARAERIVQEYDRRVYIEQGPGEGYVDRPPYKPKYLIDTDTEPAKLAEEMEHLTAEDVYRSIDELEGRLFNKYMPGKKYVLSKAELMKQENIPPIKTEGKGKELRYGPRASEAYDAYVKQTEEEMDELARRLTPEELAVREKALDVYEQKLIEEGKATPGDKVPRMRSAKHLEEVTNRRETGKRDVYSSRTGWRPASEVESDARIQSVHMPYNEDEAIARLKSISNRQLTGELTAEEALENTIQLEESVISTENMTFEQKESFLHALGPVLSQLRKATSLIAFFAMLGVGPELFALLAGGDTPFTATAEAAGGGVFRAGLKAAFTRAAPKVLREAAAAPFEEVKAGLMAAMKKGNLIVEQVRDANKLVLAAQEFMTGIPDSKLGGPTEVLKNLNNWMKKDIRPRLHHRLLGPYQKFEEVLQIGKNIMNNPAVFKAAYQTAEYVNIKNANSVLDNIFKEAVIQDMPIEIAERFKHLVPLMERQVGYEFHVKELEEVAKKIESIKKSKSSKKVKDADLANHEAIYEWHKNSINELAGSVEHYHSEWAKAAAQAARDIPSVRVYLSLWDGPEFTRAPFMKNIRMHPSEEVLVGRLREQLLQYKIRMDARDVKTIKGPYAPVMLHPDFGAERFSQISGHEKAAAYMKFYRRSPASRPLFPAAETSMRRYVADTERRIQNTDFWNSGWEEVEMKTRDFPIVAQAFEALREGIRPIEWTWGNRLAHLYVQMEAYKRLWLNPSAGGKHLTKQSATWAIQGFGETWKAYPDAYRHIVRRSMDLGKRVRASMSRGGVTSRVEQDKIVDSFLYSVIPARNARQRLIDLGFNVREEYFTGMAQAWHKGQNVGSVWINLAELFDRGVTAIAGINMAAKRGMTAEQAMYGIYDLILKNNFLSRELSPGWLRNPKIRAFLMFQGTPFKIAERRVVQAYRAGRAINKGWKALREASKTPEGRTQLFREFKDLRYLMKTTEREFKANLFIDALRSETDFFGTPIVNQFAKDIAIIGAASYGGAHWGMNLKHHFFHVPFISGMTHDPVIAFSPGPMNMIRAIRSDEVRTHEDEDWMFKKFLDKWLGSSWLAPDIWSKVMRMHKNDIPELYRGSKFQYLFAIPSKEK